MTTSEGFERALWRAHRRGRARYALVRALPVAAFGALVLSSGHSAREAALAAALLVLVTAVAAFRSRAGLHGAVAGVLLGAAPLVVGLALPASWHLEMGAFGACLAPCAVACAIVGVAVGAWLTTRVARLGFGRLDCVLAAITTGLVATLVGCQVFGLGTGLGALGGVAFGVGLGRVAVRRPA